VFLNYFTFNQSKTLRFIATGELLYSMISNRAKFDIAPADEVVQQSSREITSSRLFRAKSRIPDHDGVLSLYMGSIDRRLRCLTCENDLLDCSGHPGHIKLFQPIYHVSFVKHLLKALRVICYWCTRVIASPGFLYKKGPASATNLRLRVTRARRTTGAADTATRRSNSVSAAPHEGTARSTATRSHVSSGGKTCTYCKGCIPGYKQVGHRIGVTWPAASGKKSGILQASKALSILERAIGVLCPSDGDIDVAAEVSCEYPEVDGGDPAHQVFVDHLRRLKNSILTVLLVPPPAIRPARIHDIGNGSRGQDDLTKMLQAIVVANNAVREKWANSTKEQRHALVAIVQWTISVYMHNDVRGEKKSTNRTGSNTGDVRLRLVGKQGRIRAHLMGKRVDYSGRTVITPNIDIDLDEVGVPEFMADTLLFQERVTALNIQRLTAGIHSGRCRQVVKVRPGPSQRLEVVQVDLSRLSAVLPLEIGWKIKRPLENGDYVCMNRHPSLHRVSMMGHRVVVMPGVLTLQMNPGVCPPYNADFDGDEMNLHLPTDYEAKGELQHLMSVAKNMISPQNSHLSVGAVQDCAMGLYMLSQTSVMERHKFFQFLCDADIENFRLPNPNDPRYVASGGPYTGYTLMSAFLPATFSFTATTHVGGQPNHVVIEDGLIIEGRFTKTTIHAVLVAVALDYSSETAATLLTLWQRIACSFVTASGFTVTIDDCLIDDDSANVITKFLDEALATIAASNAPDETKSQTLSSLLGKVGIAAQRGIASTNAIKMMADSEAKGNSINATQIRGALGQQIVNGVRPNGRLPCFVGCDPELPERRGFIRSSYTSGLSPYEFFYHAMSGRDGVVDTAVKTAETGYMARKLTKGLESIRVCYGDASVRNATGAIVQFKYGYDGYDAMLIQKISLLEFLKTPRPLSTLQCEETTTYSAYHNQLTGYSSRTLASTFLPCDLPRLLRRAKARQLDLPQVQQQDLDLESNHLEPERTRLLVSNLIKDLGGLSCQETFLFQAYIVFHLQYARFSAACPVYEARLYVTQVLLTRHYQALVSPGEMVGVVAAQSFAQPATQLTLNSMFRFLYILTHLPIVTLALFYIFLHFFTAFHYAGVAAYSTAGLPRLKEIVDSVATIAHPSIVLPFKGVPTASQERAVLRELRQTSLGSLLNGTPCAITADICQELDIECSTDLINSGHYVPLNMEACYMADFTPDLIAIRLGQKYECMVASLPSAPIWFLILRYDIYNGQQALLETMLNKIQLTNVRSVSVHPRAFLGIGAPFDLDASRVVLLAGGSLDHLFSYIAVLKELGIDTRQTFGNNVLTTYQLLGIEAASALLFSELRQVLCSGGTFVHNRHFQLIADVMTMTGVIMPLSRHGLHKSLSMGLLARASFEATMDQLTEGALRGEVDYFRGVSENIFIGRPPPMGTGTFDLVARFADLDPTAHQSTVPWKDTRVAIVTAIPLAIASRQLGSAISLTEGESHLKTVFTLANLLVPHKKNTAQGFNFAGALLLGEPTATPSADTDGAIAIPMECSEICDQMNEVPHSHFAQCGAYRPSSPLPYRPTLITSVSPEPYQGWGHVAEGLGNLNNNTGIVPWSFGSSSGTHLSGTHLSGTHLSGTHAAEVQVPWTTGSSNQWQQ
jgi:DNA-directed RNA polymerase II subunit RPB1